MNGGTRQVKRLRGWCVRAPGEAVNTSCARDARCALLVCVAQCKQFVSFSHSPTPKRMFSVVLSFLHADLWNLR